MDHTDKLLDTIEKKGNKPVDLKQFLTKLLLNWHLFVIFLLISLATAYLYNKLAPPVYSASSLILIKEKQADGMDLNNLLDNFQLKTNVKLANHIGILTSLSLNQQVVRKLDWKVSWFQDVFLWNYDLSENPPYQIVLDATDYYIPNLSLDIIPLDSSKYRLTIDDETYIKGQEQHIEFEQEGVFGQKFENEYFRFTLNKLTEYPEGKIFFQFNSLDQLALYYKNHVEVSSVNKDADLIELNLNGQSRLKVTQYLNELMNEYVEYGLDEKNLTTENTIQFIDRQLADIVDTLRITGDDFTEYRAKNKVFDLGQKASLVVEKLVKLESEESLLKMQINYYENLNGYLDDSERMKKMIAPSVVGVTDQALNSMVGKLIELYGNKETLSYSLEDINPSIQMLDREIAYVKRSLQENTINLINNAKQDLGSLGQEIAEIEEMLVKYPRTEQDLINIRRMFDLNNELYTFLLQKRAEAEIAKASNIPDVKIVDKATLLTLIEKGPKKRLSYIIGLFIGLFIPFSILTVRDYFDETIHTPDEVKKLTEIPLVGKVFHNSFAEAVPIVEHPRSSLAESLRDLRTNIEYITLNKYPVVIGVHSVIPSEGKSFVSTNLSAIFAMNSKKVVLVGADMRKPMLNKLLEIKMGQEGLSTYLIGQNSMDEIIKSTHIENLDLVASGPIPPNPVELLSNERFSRFLNELRIKYDVIVFDNSPLSLVTDSRIIARYTDVDLYVMRQNYSLRSAVSYINEVVERGNNKAGIILNDVDPKTANYSYGGYQRYFKKGYGYLQ
ncbi:polysaccharide biosynthesis tyrosine autokinase [uncultured Sunxiuqinia sp.]|uniref:GumC family protein n=1 Tax=uncultured Sunxiuqinia sp. TaxID=1573825 RepID=UPI002AA8E9F0|nr:polysaccharide biosynthesis tyrosine autokinase [uncultured Sunxiuqinia sp.]